ncbi:MAG: hypothetical protein AW07_03989 [Candidatus Accumulibacter sp. SK-11]|nr:MAG: hypothetical protein AW07_03989 [Candidatus Accumulibacter sp. SK-11]
MSACRSAGRWVIAAAAFQPPFFLLRPACMAVVMGGSPDTRRHDGDRQHREAEVNLRLCQANGAAAVLPTCCHCALLRRRLAAVFVALRRRGGSGRGGAPDAHLVDAAT